MEGWRTTVNGEDVYTEDGEWFWFHEQQGWFHVPGLVLEPPPPPASVRARDWGRRMTTGWPNPLAGLRPRNTKRRNVGTVNWLTCWFLRFVLFWMWVLVVTINWGWDWTINAQWKFVTGFCVNYGPCTDHTGLGFSEPRPWTLIGDDHNVLVLTWLFVVITLACIYLLYMTVMFQVDPHKGYAMLGAVGVLSAVAGHRRRQRERDHRLAQDVAAELDRRHHRHGFGFR
jgi:hypothetical protein